MRIERHVSDGVTVVSIAEPTEIDAATADSFKEAVAAAIDELGRVGVLVNNAGGGTAKIVEMSDEQWVAVLTRRSPPPSA